VYQTYQPIFEAVGSAIKGARKWLHGDQADLPAQVRRHFRPSARQYSPRWDQPQGPYSGIANHLERRLGSWVNDPIGASWRRLNHEWSTWGQPPRQRRLPGPIPQSLYKRARFSKFPLYARRKLAAGSKFFGRKSKGFRRTRKRTSVFRRLC